VQIAAAEGIEEGWKLTAANVVACAKFRLMSIKERREAGNVSSYDAFLETDVDFAARIGHWPSHTGFRQRWSGLPPSPGCWAQRR
jgi:hypothetical protein